MRLFLITLMVFFIPFLLCAQSAFRLQLNSLSDIEKIEELPVGEGHEEKYLLWVKQAIDHKHPELGTFLQRVFVTHLDRNRPVVMITEGYDASYAQRRSYTNELTELLHANQICVEHRYFNKSIPKHANWSYLNTYNAASDHHHINQMMKSIYKEKWISTGISKGGQAAILYKYYYPRDVDVCVPYVAPINFKREDRRHEKFIANVSHAEAREKVMCFQKEVLKRRATLQNHFQLYCAEQGYTFNVGLDEVYDYCVLEYPFAFWQWGDDLANIPDVSASDSAILRHFLEISSPEYFSIEGTKAILPFFIQAASELGYYTYNIKPFKEWLSIRSSKAYMQRLFLPCDVHLSWKNTMKRCNREILRTGNNMLYIYGEFDPWTASGVALKGRTNALKLVSPGGSHRTRINTLPPAMKQQAIDSLHVWLSR